MELLHSFDFDKVIVLDIANNHYGSVEHALSIIEAFSSLDYPDGFRIYFKLQYRNLDTFIHVDAPSDSHYVKRFNSTKLVKDELLQIAQYIKSLPSEVFGLMITPFDEASVDWAIESKADIIKVASCSANDWPLLEYISSSNLPVLASTGGLDFSGIDNLVSFFRHKSVDFALMHCISVYPTNPEDCCLGLIPQLKSRYSDIQIGWSTHEPPSDTNVVIAAISSGASLLERHICLPSDEKPQNKYSSTPSELQAWLDAISITYNMLATPATLDRPEEKCSIKTLARGAYYKKTLRKNTIVNKSDIYYAFPVLVPSQLTASTLKFPFKLLEDVDKNSSVLPESVLLPDLHESFYLKEALHEVKALLSMASITLNSTFELELSHHYGKKEFSKVGTTIITCINREYCKKILVQLPGQKHPLHYHPRKEETFQVLYGKLDVISDRHTYTLDLGDTLTVLPGVWHAFGSESGCIFEEVSTTHFNNDSVYKDSRISSLTREQRKTIVDHWGRFQMV